jgi:hypothetical protein
VGVKIDTFDQWRSHFGVLYLNLRYTYLSRFAVLAVHNHPAEILEMSTERNVLGDSLQPSLWK